MLKYVMLATAATMSVPAMAQDTTTTQAPPATTQAAPPATAPSSDAPVATSADPAPAQGAATTAAPSQSAATEPSAAGEGQVAALLETEFPTYDKDGSGTLSKAEFAAWMNTLKAKTDPAAKPDAKWNAAAFKQADGDKSNSVSKTELASFLGGAAKNAG